MAKAYGIKVRCCGEHFGEHIGNLMGTHWELKGNIVRTHWEPGTKWGKNLLLHVHVFFRVLLRVRRRLKEKEGGSVGKPACTQASLVQ